MRRGSDGGLFRELNRVVHAVLGVGLLLAGRLLMPGPALGQTSTLTGRVVDAASDAPISQASVQVVGAGTGTTTDTTGTFVLRGLSSGIRTLTVSHVGYRSKTVSVTLASGERRRIEVALSPAPLELEAVTVQAAEAEGHGPRTQRLRARDLDRMPSAFGDDVFRSLSLLPGVTTSSDYSSQLHIRGGDADQTFVQLDGMPLYKPTHFLGFFSMLNPDLVDTVTLHKGPYPVEYDGRLGSVVAVQSQPGNRRRVTGGGAVSLSASRGYVEGPIGSDSAAIGSYRVAARRSTFEPVLAVLQDVETEGMPNGVSFYDVHARMDLHPSPNDNLSVVAYGAHDALDLHMHNDFTRFDLGYESQGVSATWEHRFGSEVSVSAGLSGSRYHTDPSIATDVRHSAVEVENEKQRFREENALSTITLDAGVRYARLADHTVKGGVSVGGRRFVLENEKTILDEDPGRRPRRRRIGGWDRRTTGSTASAYVQDTYRPARRWQLRGGLRGTYHQRGAFWRLAPQFSVRYRPTPSVQVEAAYSRNHQFRFVDRDTRMPGFDTWLMADEGVPPAEADQVSVGTSIELSEHWQLELGSYYRSMSDLHELKPWLSTFDLADRPHAQRFRTGEGRAYGGEVYLQRREGRVTGTLSYTLGRTERQFSHPISRLHNTIRVAGHDRTHDLNVALQWHLSEAWTLSSQFGYKSGRPYTPGAEDPLLDHPFPSRPDRNRPQKRYTDRLPDYHRLDVGIRRTGQTAWMDYTLSFTVANVYARENVWLHNFERKNGVRVRDDVPQMPVPVPYLTAAFQF